MRKEGGGTYRSGSKCTGPVSLGKSPKHSMPQSHYLGNGDYSSMSLLGLL